MTAVPSFIIGQVISTDYPGDGTVEAGPSTADVIMSLSMVLDGILRILSARFAMVSGLCPLPKLPRESVDSSGNKAV
jgi:hypothetical protein